MTPAPTPPNERRRLEVLWQYEVLDTVPEEVFDDLTQLAALICQAPISTLTLVDEHRQWFKSKVGLSMTETSRDISFCGHAMVHPGLFIIPDALADPRFRDNPLVTSEPHIWFYAGAPLVSPDGHPLGSLCVIDQVPRVLNEDQKKALRILGRHVTTLLELRRRSFELKHLGEERDRVQRELDAARQQLRTLARPARPAPGRKKPAARKRRPAARRKR